MNSSTVFACLIFLALGNVLFASDKPFLTADLNGDRIVNFSDMAILAKEWLQVDPYSDANNCQDLLQNAQFGRNSVAFLDGKEYVTHSQRKTLMAVSGVSDCQIHMEDDAIGEGKVTLSPMNMIGGYIYATKSDRSNIYRSRDGINWDRTSEGLTAVYRIFGTQSGAILLFRYTDGHMMLFRSTTGGSDLSDVNLPPPALTLPRLGSEAASMSWYNFHQANNGKSMCQRVRRSVGHFSQISYLQVH